MCKKWFIIVCVIIIPAMITGYSWGESDLEDGISTATDEGIHTDDELGKKDNNINFIVLEAMAAAKMKAKKGDQASKSSSGDITGDKNENSVVVGAGSQTGNIYNIQVMK
ncbi:MAG: hypothetical protein KKH97_07030 [Proteobacteria bacterium]|nr:hypothetical protein [Pseudomonadota bacterium]MBU1712299.1 hypothetical protein [Pseudomonadota bacterium]